ncbi:MAG: hypothetical protein M3N16_05135 [Actinomycetota bacterium]|nr:hypothetical protein [Actinomycetota bacterium]
MSRLAFAAVLLVWAAGLAVLVFYDRTLGGVLIAAVGVILVVRAWRSGHPWLPDGGGPLNLP